LVLELSTAFQIPSTNHGNGIHPPRLSLQVREQPHEAKVVAQIAIVRARWEGMVQSHSAQRLVAQRVHLLHSHALAGLVLPFSYFLTLLEWYDLQLHHLSSHSITLVVIFVHVCVMYVVVRPSMCLFRLFHMVCSSEKRASPTGGYYFQHITKGSVVYIMKVA
jgi:hypothetical protein